MLSAVLAVSAVTAAAAQQEDAPKAPSVTAATLVGDCNLDGKVTVMDATFLQRTLAYEELPEDAAWLRVMDTDGSGRITISDVTELQRYLCDMDSNPIIGKTFAEVYPTEPATEPITEPGTEPATEPITEPATEPVTEPATEPITEPVTEPVTEPATEPITEPATEPVTEPPAETVDTLALNAHAVTLGDAEYYALQAQTNAPQLTFASDRPDVASVDENGLVTAHTSGTATVTCTCGDLSDACVFTVMPTAAKLTLNKTELTLGVEEGYDLNSTVGGGTAAFHRPYTSDNPAVAEVTLSGGFVTAKKPGTANIACTLLNGTKAVCRVTVLPLATSMTLNRTTLDLAKNETFDFNSSIPQNTAAYHRKYYSEDPSVVSIQKSGGLAAGLKKGTTRVYCELNNGPRAYCTVTVMDDLRSIMISHLRAQIGKGNSSYVKYINAHSNLGVSTSFPWCAVFAWSALDQFATKAGKKNPIAPRKHVSEIVVQARALGAHHYVADNNYLPKPGDLFTTSALTRPDDDGRDHIGYVEYVETDAKGKVKKVHTIEGNFAWEGNGALDTYVWRGEWVPGVRNEYGSAICEYLDLEQIFKGR